MLQGCTIQSFFYDGRHLYVARFLECYTQSEKKLFSAHVQLLGITNEVLNHRL